MQYKNSFKGEIEGTRCHPADNRIYSVDVHQPHSLVLMINEYYPSFANYYAVNIGAGDGKSCNDPVYPLYQAGFSGVAIEGDVNTELEKNLPSPSIIKMIGQLITPNNAAELLHRAACPKECDFLKLDIDGYDGPIMNAIFNGGFRPKVLQIEVNPDFPPPIQFAVLYDANYRWTDKEGLPGGFYGASAAYFDALGKKHGYRTVCMDFITGFTHDITMVKEEYFHVAAEMLGPKNAGRDLREMYLDMVYGYSHFSEYGIDTFGWRYRTDYLSLLKDIWQVCMYASLRKHDNVFIPFLLGT